MAEEKVPMPPLGKPPLYLPLEFWLEAISYLDKRVEMVANGSGHGTLTVTIKLHKGRVHEVDFGEQIRVREIIEKTGNRGNPNPQQTPAASEE